MMSVFFYLLHIFKHTQDYFHLGREQSNLGSYCLQYRLSKKTDEKAENICCEQWEKGYNSKLDFTDELKLTELYYLSY